MKPPYSADEEIFRWGPLPGQYYYVADWALTVWPKFHLHYIGYSWSDFLFLFKKGRMVFPGVRSSFEEHGRKVFTDFMLVPKKREAVRDEWFSLKEALFELQEKIVQAEDLSDAEFIFLLREHHTRLSEFWLPVSLPELANYGGAPYLKEHLRELAPEENIDHLMEVLTAPTEPSYYQEEEIELAEAQDLEEHAKKYFWLQNSYAETRVLDKEFFTERQSHLSKDLRKEIETLLKGAQEAKERAKKEHGLSDETLRIAEAIATGIKWQDHRKKHVLIDLHFKTLLLKECARRLGKKFEELLKYGEHELANALEGKPLPERGDIFGLWLTKTAVPLTEEEALEFWNLYAEEHAEEGASEVTGIIASKGNVQGTVRVLLDPYAVESFQTGEVLVAPMTSPEYVFAMKKACAIVTDAGGLTSHAAIVSRELGVPCIVNTKVATKVFKDGDLVEVDTDTGIVKKL